VHPAALGAIGPPVQLTTGLACETVPAAGDAALADTDERRPKRIASTVDPRREETSRLMT
jgi:hypothetical protein